ncbi:hypothetical protein BJY04DRAFT_216997 [Aspergillus karnatakaensis]|uniref:uncharacterized protein n=1 Tax=Aspergillus karnatakaensis TaxID=1810916 RepID=UPI003CCD9E32
MRLSKSEVIPLTDCETNERTNLPLHDALKKIFEDETGEIIYANGIKCPPDWENTLDAVIPSALKYLGSSDLFCDMPKEILPDTLSVYLGKEMSFHGFRTSTAATISVDLLVQENQHTPGTIHFSTDTESLKEYGLFVGQLGKSRHTDGANIHLTTADLRTAGSPVYVTDQRPDDLVVFPAATAHQTWNLGKVTKVQWNMMHATSVVAFFQDVGPAYQQHCRSDEYRASLIPVFGIQSLHHDRDVAQVLFNAFRSMTIGVMSERNNLRGYRCETFDEDI